VIKLQLPKEKVPKSLLTCLQPDGTRHPGRAIRYGQVVSFVGGLCVGHFGIATLSPQQLSHQRALAPSRFAS
jgi:hypothetical protein